MASWIGCSVSVNCGPTLGCYQGKISEASGTKITLIKPFRNGVPYPRTEITLNSSDIVKLHIIHEKPEEQNKFRSTVAPNKPVPKRHTVSEALTSSHNQQYKNNASKNGITPVVDLTVPAAIPEPKIDNKSNGNIKLPTPFKKDKKKPKEARNEACFGTGGLSNYNQDFDFEKNLALFDKQAVWEEINASQKPDLVRQTDSSRRNNDMLKYRHDENVIATVPAIYRQITVQESSLNEYVTDDGLVIPSISHRVRDHLFRVAEKVGISIERQTELIGRAATEISLQLLGGGHRLNPRNTHQFPTVVALCGKHKQGSIGINCARQLASHGVRTVVFLADGVYDSPLKNEFNLYRLTGNKFTSDVADLPSSDLIILALSSDSIPTPFNTSLVDWVNDNRAPVLALDPPSMGTSGISTKFSLVPVLPLSHSNNNGKLYLCNLAIPEFVFKEVGIQYKSPFGPKLVIPLYLNDK